MNRAIALSMLLLVVSCQTAIAEPTRYVLDERGSVLGYLAGGDNSVLPTMFEAPASSIYRQLQTNYALPGLTAVQIERASAVHEGSATGVFQGRLHVTGGEIRDLLGRQEFPWKSVGYVRIYDETSHKYVFSGDASDLSDVKLREGRTYLLSTGMHFGMTYRETPETIDPIDYIPEDPHAPVTPVPSASVLAGIGLTLCLLLWRRERNTAEEGN